MPITANFDNASVHIIHYEAKEREMPENINYSIRYGNAVVISGLGKDDFCLNMPNLKKAIENIQNDRKSYATEKAYQRMLSAYEGAWLFLNANEERLDRLAKTNRASGEWGHSLDLEPRNE